MAEPQAREFKPDGTMLVSFSDPSIGHAIVTTASNQFTGRGCKIETSRAMRMLEELYAWAQAQGMGGEYTGRDIKVCHEFEEAPDRVVDVEEWKVSERDRQRRQIRAEISEQTKRPPEDISDAETEADARYKEPALPQYILDRVPPPVTP